MRRLTTSEPGRWGGIKDEAGDRTDSGCLEQLREEQGAEIVRSVICDNQAVGSEVGASIVFKVAKWWFTLRCEHVLTEESLSDSRQWAIGIERQV
jgi:hypothetical protein